jgi:hypothetical protein
MRQATSRESLLLKCQQNRSGARFATWFLVGRETRFPFHTSSAKKLNVTDPPIITVIGKAYFDVGHAPKDQSNRRKYFPGYAAWEIHPVMKLEVTTRFDKPLPLSSAVQQIRVYDEAGNLIDTHEQAGDFKEW